MMIMKKLLFPILLLLVAIQMKMNKVTYHLYKEFQSMIPIVNPQIKHHLESNRRLMVIGRHLYGLHLIV